MVYGASGGVGLYAVQLAKIFGATVTGVCSTRNLELAKAAGCTQVIDYKTQDFTQCPFKFDAILGINGCNPMYTYRSLLKSNGIFVGVGNATQGMKAMLASLISRHFTFFIEPVMGQKDYLKVGKKLAEAGQLKPYIDEIFSVKKASVAIKYAIKTHVQGKIVIRTDF